MGCYFGFWNKFQIINLEPSLENLGLVLIEF